MSYHETATAEESRYRPDRGVLLQGRLMFGGLVLLFLLSLWLGPVLVGMDRYVRPVVAMGLMIQSIGIILNPRRGLEMPTVRKVRHARYFGIATLIVFTVFATLEIQSLFVPE